MGIQLDILQNLEANTRSKQSAMLLHAGHTRGLSRSAPRGQKGGPRVVADCTQPIRRPAVAKTSVCVADSGWSLPWDSCAGRLRVPACPLPGVRRTLLDHKNF